ncbi:hypothetical protein DH2020_019389 [Rehmannia glutinosa]|uniref:Cytokinin riboside 5'-monophosphate phosphoribohydrolase n=1 Tax=Rehmannia glutinosa TaxID=99300 RepID=A0ABR0WLW1_REHGL
MESSSSRRINCVAVFCGANPGKDGCFLEAADNLGKFLAEKHVNLVYGGGSFGLMGRVAGSAYLGGVRVLGVIPKPLFVRQITGQTIGDELRVSNMQDRMVNMMHNADAFITLPGGFGTLEELFQVISWAQLNIHQKPIGILNVNGFFDGLLSFIDYAVEKGFISPSARRIIICATTPSELIYQLQAFVAELDPKVAHVVWSEDRSKKHRLDLSLAL